MAADGDDSTDLLADTPIDFPESDPFARVRIRLVPQSDASPDGEKSSMQYGTYDGTTLLRSDDAHGSTKGHERHTSEGTEEIEFTGWRELLDRFRQAVMEHERHHDD